MKQQILLFFLFLHLSSFSQEKLTKREAIRFALEHNYDLQLSRNNVAVAKNNSSIYNSGYLPSVVLSSGSTFAQNSSDSEFENGTSTSTSGLASADYQASVSVDYTLFDGFQRKHLLQQFKEQYHLSELLAQEVLENTLINLYSAYYEVGRLSENESALKKTLVISQKRLKRAKYHFEYGQNTQLDVLNAQIDVNNDSIAYLDLKRELANAKRNLNLILGKDLSSDYLVDTSVVWRNEFNLLHLKELSKQKNTLLQQEERNLSILKYDVKNNQSNWIPKIGLTSSYSLTKGKYDATNANSLINSTGRGVNFGINVSWNLFDGGKSKVKIRNAKIAVENQQIEQERVEQELERDLCNAWETYQNSMYTVKMQNDNVKANELNFSKTNEEFKLGRINSIDFRQAQINLINARKDLSQAKYSAKNAELYLLKLAGILLEQKL